MKKSELRQLIKEELENTVSVKDTTGEHTYVYVLYGRGSFKPKGIFSSLEKLNVWLNTAERNDEEFFKKEYSYAQLMLDPTYEL